MKKEDKGIEYNLNFYEQEYQSQNMSIESLQEKPFVCLNNNGRRDEVKSSVIKEGDYIKLGKTFLKVVETHLSSSANNHLSEQPIELNNFPVIQNRVAKTCRICLMEDT